MIVITEFNCITLSMFCTSFIYYVKYVLYFIFIKIFKIICFLGKSWAIFTLYIVLGKFSLLGYFHFWENFTLGNFRWETFIWATFTWEIFVAPSKRILNKNLISSYWIIQIKSIQNIQKNNLITMYKHST